MKTSWPLTLALALTVALAPALSDAKRLGGGKSSGMQRDMPSRSAPAAPPAQPAAPRQAAPTVPPTAPAVAPKRNWMGPLAGLAAGLGIGALLSHFGMGGALGGMLGSLLMFALLAVVGIFVVRFLMSRFGGARQASPALAGAGAGFGGGSSQRMGFGPDAAGAAPQAGWSTAPSAALPPAALTTGSAIDAASATAPVAAVAAVANVPAHFDADGFARIAKTIFVRLQAANDKADLDDLRRFTTAEMFAELRVDLLERGPAEQQTDVLQVDAQVLDVAEEAQRQIVSVRFHGLVRESAGATPVAFDEVWHLVKPNDGSREWAIAGIEQQQQPQPQPH